MRLRLLDASGQELALADAPAGQTYAQAIWLAPGIQPKALCGGLGLCGRCRIRFLHDAPPALPDEELYFSPSEIREGWRLGCRHKIPPAGGMRQIMLPHTDGKADAEPEAVIAGSGKCFLGIDLGTTSIQWRCVDSEGASLAQASMLNPQAPAGADVISRLQFCALDSNRDQLAGLVLREFSILLDRLASQGLEVKCLCVAANSVMTHILLKRDLRGLSSAPYSLDTRGCEIAPLRLDKISLPCIIPPLPAPFVGGDISAGILAILVKGMNTPVLLADFGTNAELALLLPGERLYLASAPLGPAMEGIGPECGQPAGAGVAVAFSLGPAGIIPHFHSQRPGPYISATGYISLLSLLLNLGLMDRKGHFIHSSTMPLQRRIQNSMREIHGQNALRITDKLFMTSGDVELLLKVKAILRVALSRLLEAAGLGVNDIKHFVMAGAISENVNIPDMVNLGIIPAPLEKCLTLAGNTSLEGACILARDPSRLDMLCQLCAAADIIDLVDDPAFLQTYLAEMTWE